jgi:hypothetical protein
MGNGTDSCRFSSISHQDGRGRWKLCYTTVGWLKAAAYQDLSQYDLISFSETFVDGNRPYIDIPGYMQYVCNGAEGQYGGIQVSLRDKSSMLGRASEIVVRSEPWAGIIWVQARNQCYRILGFEMDLNW